MRDPRKLFVEIKLISGDGQVQAIVTEEVSPDVAYRGPRIAEDMRLGLIDFGGTSPMAAAVKVLQVREIRRKLFRDLFPRMAERMTDFLHDREGWSDPSRQDATERIARDASKL